MSQNNYTLHSLTTLYDILKKYRKDKNLTQEQLSEIIGVSCRTISYWEYGRLPNRNHLEKILQLEDIKKYITH